MNAKPFLLLLAEDNEDDAIFFRRSFKRFLPGWQMERVCDGRKALEYCQEKGFPHLLVTDLNMPFVDGLELIQWFRARDEGQDSLIIVNSSFGTPEMKQACLEAGANHTCIKKSGSEELTQILRQVMAAIEARGAGNSQDGA